jgi:integrase
MIMGKIMRADEASKQPDDLVEGPKFPPLSAKRGKGGNLTNEDIERWSGFVDRPAKLSDGNGLHVIQRTLGGKKVFRVRLPAPAGDFTLGHFPDMTIEGARKSADDARRLAAQGENPTVYRQEQWERERIDVGVTFGTMAYLYWKTCTDNKLWTKEYSDDISGILNNWIKPYSIWKTPLRRATVAQATAVLDDCASKSPSTSLKVQALIKKIAAHGQQYGYIQDSPLIRLSSSPIATKYRKDQKRKLKNMPAIVDDMPRLGRILRESDLVSASWQTKKLHRFVACLGQRASVCAEAMWKDIDLENMLWRIPRPEMKNIDQSSGGSDRGWRRFHEVPLPRQIVSMLRKLNRDNKYVFYGIYDCSKHITIEALEKHLREQLGLRFQHSPHSYRSSMSTFLNGLTTDDGKRVFDAIDIELLLDHEVGSSVAKAYNRGVAVARLRPLVQTWADALENAEMQAEEAALKRE